MLLQREDIESNATTATTANGLTERYTHKRSDRTKGLIYEFTRDEAYLHQYYLLRSRLMQKALGWHLDAGEDPYDKRSHILVVRKGNQVVGGGRLIIRSPRKNEPLLLEDDNFSLIDALPELKLANRKYAEVSRFVLLEEFQHTTIPYKMFCRLYDKYKALNISYGFSSVSDSAARIYMKFSKMRGVNCTPLYHIKLPDKPHYEGRVMKLIMFDDYADNNRPVIEAKQDVTAVHGGGDDAVSAAKEELVAS